MQSLEHRARRGAACGVVGIAALLCGCAHQTTMPDPEPVVDAYAQALQAADVDAIYEMMSEESRQTLSRKELERILSEQRAELGEHAKALQGSGRELSAQAQVRYNDGEIATLDLVDGEFRVTAADALPAAGRTPEQALSQLRRVLARRSYTGLLRVLTPRTRNAVEGDLRSLVEGLNAPDALTIDVVGDTATVIVPGGHRVELRREDGVWHVDDFD